MGHDFSDLIKVGNFIRIVMKYTGCFISDHIRVGFTLQYQSNCMYLTIIQYNLKFSWYEKLQNRSIMVCYQNRNYRENNYIFMKGNFLTKFMNTLVP